jgi:phage gp46-like protein
MAKLKTLVKGLKDRPKLALEVNGTYDKGADWRAIKSDVLANDFKVLRKQSTRTDSWVYQMLYQRRFGLDALWVLTKKFKSKTGVYDDAKIIEEAKRRLVEDGAADKVALAALALERAKVVHDLLVADGLDSGRVSVGPSHEVQASMDFVPLEFTLTVFGDKTDSGGTLAPKVETPAAK